MKELENDNKPLTIGHLSVVPGFCKAHILRDGMAEGIRTIRVIYCVWYNSVSKFFNRVKNTNKVKLYLKTLECTRIQ